MHHLTALVTLPAVLLDSGRLEEANPESRDSGSGPCGPSRN